MADSLEELHKFAMSVNLKKCWFHGVRKGHPHYDLPNKLRLEIMGKAKIVSSKDLVNLYNGAERIASI